MVMCIKKFLQWYQKCIYDILLEIFNYSLICTIILFNLNMFFDYISPILYCVTGLTITSNNCYIHYTNQYSSKFNLYSIVHVWRNTSQSWYEYTANHVPQSHLFHGVIGCSLTSALWGVASFCVASRMNGTVHK